MTQTIRDVVVAVHLKSGGSKLTAPDTKQAEKAFKSLQADADKSATRVSESLKPIAPKITEITRATEAAKREQANLGQVVKEESIKSSESFTAAAEGALTFTRGITLLGIESEDSLQKVVSELAKIQGAIDILKGGTAFIKGIGESITALQTASTAASAGQSALGASSSLAAKGLSGVLSLTNPVALGLTAATAAGVGLFAILSNLGGDGADSLNKVADAAARLRKEQEAARKLQQNFDSNSAIGGFRQGGEDELRRLKSAKEQLAELNKNREAALRRARQNTAGDLGLLLDIGTTRQGTIDDQSASLRSLLERQAKRFAKGANERATPGFSFAELERTGKLKTSSGDAIRQDREADAEAAQRTAQALTALAKRELDLAREKSQIIKSQVAEQRSVVDLAKQELATKQELLKAEKDRLSTAAQKIGRLGAEDTLRLQQVSKSVAAGDQLRRDDAEFLDRIGLGRQLSNKFFEQSGKAAGSDEILRNLGEGSRAPELQASVNAARGRLDAQKELQSTLEQQAERSAEVVAREVRDYVESQVLERKIEDKVREVFNRRDAERPRL